MADVGGTLSFDDIGPCGPAPELPGVVPVVDGTAGVLHRALGWPAYGIGLRRVLSDSTWTLTPKWRTARHAADALGLPETCAVVLVGYGTDPLVEGFWTHRHELYELLAAKSFALVLAPNYSIYGNHPRTEHLLNMRRNLVIADELSAAGVPAVPNLYWWRAEDLRRAAAWAADVSPPAVAVNLQTFRQDADWRSMALPGMAYLAGELDPAVRVIVCGTVEPSRVRVLLRLFGPGRLTFIVQRPIQAARHGEAIAADGTTRRVYARAEEAFAYSVRSFADLLAGAGTDSEQDSEQEVSR